MVIEGFTFADWYTMPVHLRHFYTKMAEKIKEEQNKLLENS